MANNGSKETINKVFKKRDQIKRISRDKKLIYIKNNLHKDLSGYYLTQQPLDTIGKYKEELSAEVQNGLFKNKLNTPYEKFQDYVGVREAEKKVTNGKLAPDFQLKSLPGSDLALNSIDGKVIVLDFWGSWCAPCLKEFPKLKEFYKKYDNLEIVGIAVNDTEEKWKEAIAKNSLDWLHVINNEELNNDVSVLYGVKNYPTKFILDENKVIVGKYVGLTDNFYKKLDEILKTKGSF